MFLLFLFFAQTCELVALTDASLHVVEHPLRPVFRKF